MSNRPRTQHLLIQGLASAITALLLVAGVAWGAAPSDRPTSSAGAEAADDEASPKPPKPPKPPKAAKNEDGKAHKGTPPGKPDNHGARVSAAARGELAPKGSCRNHGHWVSTVAKGLNSCDDNPRPPGDD